MSDPRAFEIASSQDHQGQIDASTQNTHGDEQVISCDMFTSLSLDCPATPVNREARPMNLPPGPKAGYSKDDETKSPTYNLHGRVRNNHHGDSTDESGDISMDSSPIMNTPKKPWFDIYGGELPKTPTRKFSRPRDQNNRRTASPKCPSLDRSKYPGRSYRVRSPLTHNTQSRWIPTPPKSVPLVQGALLDFNKILEDREKKRNFL